MSRRLGGDWEPAAEILSPRSLRAKDLYANSVQMINATSGAKARSEGNLYGTAKAVPFHEPLRGNPFAGAPFALTLRAFQRA
jgi:hypothetical protein